MGLYYNCASVKLCGVKLVEEVPPFFLSVLNDFFCFSFQALLAGQAVANFFSTFSTSSLAQFFVKRATCLHMRTCTHAETKIYIFLHLKNVLYVLTLYSFTFFYT